MPKTSIVPTRATFSQHPENGTWRLVGWIDASFQPIACVELTIVAQLLHVRKANMIKSNYVLTWELKPCSVDETNAMEEGRGYE